ncbi:L-ribulose-5-phosphate 4-epimerase [Yersinia ruckeri]|uniref:L-ribulose-5-phosphate 4-epimerase n=1 Tax=Yersinia ruckeri TaxID=29486 RepID=UPI0020BF4C66|nr:L-ribulose-5-phosphate 4-epimerase [Yersinia ruckeri]MCW6538420.1 L-ribulose-5-phosphate 4-epimerase [Yersinia ruckeri]MCW6636573.1 L-ribulose-5-phosphate 4-epimerase [Yersinia ruckeri]UZX66776.1 L-ribulose-5-phosphate 4-epimerase [Yersinia ruckeri]UZY09976.1 L-ribulose-5-phosphate 4-epimerase [Yersinia ruckeri]
MYQTLKQRVLDANLLLPHFGLVTFTWGNASEIDRQRGVLAIKPSGVEYDQMKAENIVVLDLDGKVIEGDLNPSSDTPTHLELYRRFPALGGIVHTHSRHATIWAQAGKDLPALGTTHADYFYGDIPCTRPLSDNEINQHYEENSGRVIEETFNRRGIDPVAVPGVLLYGHAPFTWGKDAQEAVHNAVVLEEVAAMALATRSLNTHIHLQHALSDKHYQRKHGNNAYYGQR